MTEDQGTAEARARGQARRFGQKRPKNRARKLGRIRPPRVRVEPDGEVRVSILSDADILEARRQGREMAGDLGFSSIDRTLIATAISELTRNIVHHASEGELRLRIDGHPGSAGMAITATDNGPGIRDVRGALEEGSSTSRGLGLGLPGVKRIMDEFDIDSKPRQGTTITVKKWKDR